MWGEESGRSLRSSGRTAIFAVSNIPGTATEVPLQSQYEREEEQAWKQPT